MFFRIILVKIFTEFGRSAILYYLKSVSNNRTALVMAAHSVTSDSVSTNARLQHHFSKRK